MRVKKSPEIVLLLLAAGSGFCFAVWQNLLNNFAILRVNFTGAEMGILQSLREVPGFLAFTIVFVLWWLREQSVAYLALVCLGIGVLLTGMFPSVLGLYLTTVLMSIGFHYLETVQNSLSLQWVEKTHAPHFFGRVIAVKSAAAMMAFITVWLLFEQLQLDYVWLYMLGGGVAIVIAASAWVYFPKFEGSVAQTKTLVLRQRYWLFYALQFMGGARRQIFVVFAGFLLVEKFGFSVGEISLLFLANSLLNMFLAPRIGRWVGVIGERRALLVEYLGLIIIFIGYALVESGSVAVGLYIFDHVFFAMAIAQKTYFQKIADPADIASTAGVSFTINHIAAVIIPVLFGLLWLHSPAWVFFSGAAMAGVSLLLACLVPVVPEPGTEVAWPALRRP